jgi:hypothetical protein
LTEGARHAAAEPSVGSLAAYAHALTQLHGNLGGGGGGGSGVGGGGGGGGDEEGDEAEEDEAGAAAAEGAQERSGGGGLGRLRAAARSLDAAPLDEPLTAAERASVKATPCVLASLRARMVNGRRTVFCALHLMGAGAVS